MPEQSQNTDDTRPEPATPWTSVGNPNRTRL